MSPSPVVFTNPETVAPPHGAYSNVATVRAGSDMLFLSGQLGVFADGTLAEGVEAQYAQAVRNVVAILEAEGVDLAGLVKITTYLVEPLPVEAVRAIRRSLLPGAAPAATLVYVPRLGTVDRLVEVEAIAARSPRTCNVTP